MFQHCMIVINAYLHVKLQDWKNRVFQSKNTETMFQIIHSYFFILGGIL